MNTIAPRPTIRDIKVTERFANCADSILLEWMDRAGAERRFEMFGATANVAITDLHACTLMGEDARHAYLIGTIRMVERYAMEPS